MTRKTLTCARCGFTIRRDLANQPGSRGVHETPAEFGACPRGHGPMIDPDQPALTPRRPEPAE